MAPGAKKKNVNRRTGDNLSDNKKVVKNDVDVTAVDNQHQISKANEVDQDNNQDKKYNKRAIASNWQKYEETLSNPHADTLRGKDFEVLLSYSGGSGSQLQLQNEKEWEEANVDEKSISLDLKDVIHVMKSVPFHKLINLPVDIFSQDQISSFDSSAESWRNSYKPDLETSTDRKTIEKHDKAPETLDSDLNIIDCESEDMEDVVPLKSVLLEEKTENIIESLASCLSLKTSVPEKSICNTAEAKKETQNLPDDLDFLLSLNVSLKNPLQDEKPSESKTNVDDWLNSILDD